MGISFRLIVQTSFNLGWFKNYLYLTSPMGSFQFLIGPAVFFHLRNIIGLYQLEFKKNLLHWFPAIIVFVDLLIGLIFAGKSSVIYESFNAFQYDAPGLITRRYLIYLFGAQNIFYILSCFKLLIKSIEDGRLIGVQARLVMHWVLFLFFPMIILFSYFQFNFNSNVAIDLNNHHSILVRAIYLFIIIVFVVKSDGLKSIKPTAESNSENANTTPINLSLNNNPLKEQAGWTDQPNSTNVRVAHALYNDEHNIRKLIHYIEEFVAIQKPFKIENYGIENLSADLKIPQHHIRYIFKYYNTLGFVNYRNSYRILDFMDSVKEKGLQNKTMESLALECGFGSHSAFLTAFKKIYGKNPNEIIYSKLMD